MRIDNNGNFTADKSPGDVIDYGFDWTEFIEAGETIVTSTWASGSSALTLSGAQVSSGVTSVIASGGTLGTSVFITNTITTSESRTIQRAIKLIIKVR